MKVEGNRLNGFFKINNVKNKTMYRHGSGNKKIYYHKIVTKQQLYDIVTYIPHIKKM